MAHHSQPQEEEPGNPHRGDDFEDLFTAELQNSSSFVLPHNTQGNEQRRLRSALESSEVSCQEAFELPGSVSGSL